MWSKAGDDADGTWKRLDTDADKHKPTMLFGGHRPTSARPSGTGRFIGSLGNQFTKPDTEEQQARERQAFDFFKSKGWSAEQSAGIVANIKAESSFNEHASGDGGMAYGLAQCAFQ